MKLYTTQTYKDSETAFGTNGPRVFEAPDEIFINGFAHDKETLAPIFGRMLPANFTNKGILSTNHYAGKPYVPYRRGSSVHSMTANVMHPVNGSCGPTATLLSGQTFMHGTVQPKKIWQSTKNPDLIYWEGHKSAYDSNAYAAASRNHTHGYYYTYEMNRKTLQIREYNTGYNVHHEDLFMFHEDDEYIYGMAAGAFRSWHAAYQVTLFNKSDLTLTARGFGNTSYCNSMLAIENDEVYTWAGRFNNTAYTGSAYISKNSFATLEAIKTNAQYTSSIYHKYETGTPHVSYPFLRMGLRAGGLSNHAIARNGQDYSNGDIQSVEHETGSLIFPGIVHDAALKAVGVMRIYNMFWNGTGSHNLMLGRTNVKINGATESDDGFDYMPCTITSSNGTTIPTKETFCGASGTYYEGNGSYGYKGSTVRYFEDTSGGNTRGYLLVAGDYESHDKAGSSNAFYVFKITNHTASITSSLVENDSLSLDLIQAVDVGYCLTNLFAPDRDHKKFVAMSRDSTSHDFFSWNSTTEQFTTSSSLNGEILRLATDSKGRIFSFHQDSAQDNIHLESLTLPNKVSVEMDADRYAYNGTTVNAIATVDVFNYEGTRLAKTVNLEIVGSSAVFAGGGKTKTVSTSAASSTSVQIDISGPTFVKVNGTVSA